MISTPREERQKFKVVEEFKESNSPIVEVAQTGEDFF